jgi:hypothetical protein
VVDLFRYIDPGYLDADYVEDITEYAPGANPSYEQPEEDYFEEGYLELGYFQPPETNVYIESGYIDDGYYERIIMAQMSALAYVNVSAVATIIESEGQVKDFEADLTVTATLAQTQPTARIRSFSMAFFVAPTSEITASREINETIAISTGFTMITQPTVLEGIEMFAFSDALLAAAVNRIADCNLDAASVFDIGTDYIRVRQSDSDIFSLFDNEVEISRSRDFYSDAQAAFSFDCFVSVIVDRSPQLFSDTTIESQVNVITDAVSDQTTEVTTEVTAQVDRQLDSVLSATTEQNATAQVTRDLNSLQQAEFSQDTVVEKTTDITADFESQADIVAENQRTRDYTAAISAESQQTASAHITTDIDLALDAAMEFSVSIAVVRDVMIVASDFAEVTANVNVITDIAANAVSDSEVSAIAFIQVDFAADFQTTTDVAIDNGRSRDIDLALSASSTATATATRIIRSQADINSSSEFTASIGRIRQPNLVFLRRTAKTVTTLGNTFLDTAQKQFGNASARFDGTNSRLETGEFQFVTNQDFTIEFWLRPQALPSDSETLIDFRNASEDNSINLRVSSSGVIVFRTGTTNRIGLFSVGANLWSHVALVRQGSTTQLFVRGFSSGTSTTSINNNPRTLTIGSTHNNTQHFNGWIDDLRIVQGSALYTANFTPPTQQLTDISGTELMLNMNIVTDTTTFFDTVATLGVPNEYSAEADLTIDNTRSVGFASTITAVSSLTAIGARAQQLNSDITAEFTTSVDNTRTRDHSSDHFTRFLQDSAVNVITDNLIAADSEFEVYARGQEISELIIDIIVSESSMTALVGKIVSETIGENFGGIKFTPVTNLNPTTGVTDMIGNRFLQLRNRQVSPLIYQEPEAKETFLISFWAKDAQGGVFTTNGRKGFRFGTNTANNTFTFESSAQDINTASMNRTVTFSGLNTQGWHHYTVYQKLSVVGGSPTSNVRLVVDGQDRGAGTVGGSSGQTIYMIDSLFIYEGSFTSPLAEWKVGGNYETLSYFDVDLQRNGVERPFSGELRQFVFYFQNFQQNSAAVSRIIDRRDRLYDGKLVDLGVDGTGTGLPQPPLYLELSTPYDLTNRGYLIYGGSTANPNPTWTEIVDLYQYQTGNFFAWDIEDRAAETGDQAQQSTQGLISRASLGGLAFSGVTAQGLLHSKSELSALAGLVVIFEATVTATTSLSCNTGVIYGQKVTAIESTTEFNISEGRTRTLDSDLQSEFTQITDAIRGQFYDSDLTAEFTQVIDNQRTRDHSSDLSSDVTTIADVSVITDCTVEMFSSGGVMSVTVVTTDIVAEITAIAGLDCVISRTRDLDSAQTAEFSIEAEGIRGAAGDIICESIFTATVNVIRVRDHLVTAQATTDFDENLIRIRDNQVELLAWFSKLTAGEVINIDPALELVIPAETRGLRILPESRTYTIPQDPGNLRLIKG